MILRSPDSNAGALSPSPLEIRSNNSIPVRRPRLSRTSEVVERGVGPKRASQRRLPRSKPLQLATEVAIAGVPRGTGSTSQDGHDGAVCGSRACCSDLPGPCHWQAHSEHSKEEEEALALGRRRSSRSQQKGASGSRRRRLPSRRASLFF